MVCRLVFHQQVMELKTAVINRTLPENATTLEKEKVEIPDAKRCKAQRDVKKSVDKVIYDNFRSLNNNQIYIEFVNSAPSAHTFSSCSFCQRACPSLLSQLFRLQPHSHALTPRTRVAQGAHCLCLAPKQSHFIAQCHTLHLT